MAEPMPVAIIIYGASGDLSQLKLVPAIYELAREKLLSEKFVLVGYARSTEKKDPTTKQVIGPMNDEQFRKDSAEAIRKHARHKPIDEELLGRRIDRKSTRLNSSHMSISYAVFCLKKKT